MVVRAGDPALARDGQGGALALPRLGYGGGSLFGVAHERDASDLIDYAFERGFRYFDVAPLYGNGLAEHFTGAALRRRQRSDFVLSTKVGRRLRPSREPVVSGNGLPFEYWYDYSYDGTMRSLEDSLQRLGLTRVDIVYLHDVNPRWHGDDYERQFSEAMGGAYRALDRLRSEGVVRAIGVGVKGADVCARFARAGDFNCFMLAGGYTLLEHDVALEDFLPLCVEKRRAVIIASPFNSGILATGATAGATFFYQAAPAEIVDRTRRLQTVCDRHRVPLGAVALQFALAHPAVVSAVCGYRSRTEVDTNRAWSELPIAPAVWDELKQQRLLPDHAPTPSTGLQA